MSDDHDDDNEHDGWLDMIPERLAVFEAEESELRKRLAYIASQISWLRSVPNPNKIASAPPRSSGGHGGPRKIITYEAVRQAIQDLSNDFKAPVIAGQQQGFTLPSMIAKEMGLTGSSPPLNDILRKMVEDGEAEAIPFKRGNQYRWRLPNDPPGEAKLRDYRQSEGKD